MVRNYVRKTNRGSWDEKNMELAVKAVKNNEMSLRKAASSYSVPKDSLHRRVNGKLKSIPTDTPNKPFLGPYRKVLTNEQEKELASYIIKMDSAFYGLSIQDLQSVVFEYVETNKIKHPFNKEKKLAGRDFIAAFLKRQSILSVRKPEAVSLNRVFGLNKSAVNRYFDNLEKVVNEQQLEPHRIFNCDESGLTCVHKPLKVIAQKGKRVVSSVTSAERGQTTTILLAMNATGTYIPPMMIFKRKRMKESLIDHAPTGTLGCCSDSGWIDTELFMSYIKHFVKHTQCSPQNKCLLILDGHKSHTKNIELLNYASEKGLLMISLAPHTSHKLQPLDRSVFKSLKAAYNVACSNWLRKHPARRISVDEIGELFHEAYKKAATIENAEAGFRASGIYPYNREILPESDYIKDTRSEPENHPPEDENITPNHPGLSAETTTSSSINVDISHDESFVSFTEILPVPEIPAKVSKRKGEFSEILTSSPYKKTLIEKSKNDKKTSSKKSIKVSNQKNKKKVAQEKREKAKVARSNSDSEPEDWECVVCGDVWSRSTKGEDWTLCKDCNAWCHEYCCEKLDFNSYICDICSI